MKGELKQEKRANVKQFRSCIHIVAAIHHLSYIIVIKKKTPSPIQAGHLILLLHTIDLQSHPHYCNFIDLAQLLLAMAATVMAWQCKSVTLAHLVV